MQAEGHAKSNKLAARGVFTLATSVAAAERACGRAGSAQGGGTGLGVPDGWDDRIARKGTLSAGAEVVQLRLCALVCGGAVPTSV